MAAGTTDDPSLFGIELQRRITEKIKSLTPGSKEMRTALKHIGRLIVIQARKNIRTQGIIDTKRLHDSLQAVILEKGTLLRVGSGEVYARFHEQGGPVSEAQRRAIFARLREEGKLGRVSKKLLKPGSFEARPYFGPAVKDVLKRADIVKLMRQFLVLGG